MSGCSGHAVVSEGMPSVVPVPESIVPGDGHMAISHEMNVFIMSDAEGIDYAVGELARLARRIFGDRLDISCSRFSAPDSDDLSMVLPESAGKERCRLMFAVDPSLSPSSYRLEIAPDGIGIYGGDAAGCFYAVQTLRQIVPAEAYSGKRISYVDLPVMTVFDGPDMQYRGLMLDVARHFFTVDEVKEVLDIMAMHKLNIFHWHLTDDQGWRIEIDRYPELTRIGSVRKRTIIGKDPGGEYDETTMYDETPHGGYYTKDQIREIVAYAAARFITVIPEVEFPGHAVAALASYPWLSCTGEQYEVRQTWDIDDRVFCIGKESTFGFMEDVLSEVMELFPSEYIHIGGDECPDKMWMSCPDCRRRIQEANLPSFRALQGYGVARLGAFLESHGRHLIGWDEILEAGVTPMSVVMSWRGAEGGIRAANQGNRVIMCPTEYCYFDYYQSEDIENEPLAWGGLITLDKAYSFDPYAGLDSDVSSNILGVQANLWTEYISDIEGVEYMLLPRLAALAETGWSTGRKDWADFRQRMSSLVNLYDIYGLSYADYAQNED